MLEAYQVTLNRFAKRRDENEQSIVDALLSIGCTVYRLDEPCDLICGRGAKNILLEVKTETGRDTKKQKRFFADWRGQVAVVRTPEEAIEVVQRLTVKTVYP